MPNESDSIVAAFTIDQAARLTGVSRRQLGAWHRSGFFSPSLASGMPGPFARLYSFRDLASLKVLHQLRNEARVSLRHLDEVKRELQHLGDDLWLRSTLYRLGRRVVIERDDETRHEAGSGQEVFQIPLKVIVGGLRERIRDFNRRTAEEVGRVERRRGIVGRQAVLAGTRIPVAAIREFAEAGYGVEQILEEYPTLSPQDVEAALSPEHDRDAA